MRQFFKDVVNPQLLRRFGVAPAPRTRFLAGQRQEIIGQLELTTVLDVGANTGQYARELRRLGYSGAIHSFEPGSEALQQLERSARDDARWFVHPIALGVGSGTADLHAWKGAGSSTASLRLPGAGLLALLGEPASENVRVERLDDWLQMHDAIEPGRTLLKLDVQGSEADVLAGAPLLSAHVAAIEVELPLVAWYEGEASLIGLVDHLSRIGFVPSSIMTERFNEAWLGAADVDALFVRRNLSRVPV